MAARSGVGLGLWVGGVKAAGGWASNGRRRRPHRDELRPGEVLCQYCPAKCCRYFALPIEPPTEWEDFEYIRWFLMHRGAAVFTEDADWYLMVYTPCKHLRDDNLCEIYEDRPQVCRDYQIKDCEYEDDWVYEQYFELPEQIEEYAEALLLRPRKGSGIRSPRPPKDGCRVNARNRPAAIGRPARSHCCQA